VEKSFGLYMGAFVESVENATITKDGNIVKSKDARVKIDYLSALKIYPITFKEKSD
jgi:archaellum component FlaF (FlaF/FlaG flagellin family)